MVKLSINRKEIKVKQEQQGNNKVDGLQKKVEILYCPLSPWSSLSECLN